MGGSLRTSGSVNGVGSGASPEFVDAVSTFHIVVTFKAVEVVVALTPEESVEPARTEDVFVVVIPNPFDSPDTATVFDRGRDVSRVDGAFGSCVEYLN